jgi:hypothetical protein
LWYQTRPLSVEPPVWTFKLPSVRMIVGDSSEQKDALRKAVVTVKLKDRPDSSFPSVSLQPNSAIEVTEGLGGVRAFQGRELCWQIRAKENGYHRLTFVVDGQSFEKELAIGDRYMRVSTLRPGWNWKDPLFNPAEKPFARESPVQSIEIEYPVREEWMSGKDTWVIWWFIVSFVTAFVFRRALKVNI